LNDTVQGEYKLWVWDRRRWSRRRIFECWMLKLNWKIQERELILFLFYICCLRSI